MPYLLSELIISILYLIGSFNSEPIPVYPYSNYITGVSFNMSTLKNECPGNGLGAHRSDNWTITWADDGHQYTSWGDGGGFGGDNQEGRSSMGVARVEGDKDNYSGFNVWGGKNPEGTPATFKGKSYGIISIDGTLYMWRSGDGKTGQCYGQQAIYRSDDYAKSWVETEAVWDFPTDENAGFFVPTFLQFGQDYQGARDEYVYVYAPDHTVSVNRSSDNDGNDKWDVNLPGRINLMRVHKKSVGEKSAYLYFTGYENGKPIWSKNLEDRKPVFEDKQNGVMRTSVIYNPGLKRYILTVQQGGRYKKLNGRKAYVGIYEAPEPWGPWSTVLFTHPWDLGDPPHLMNNQYPGDPKTVYFNFSPKWWSNGGKDFVMVYTGPGGDQWGTVEGNFDVKSPDVGESHQTPYPMSDLIASVKFDSLDKIIRMAEGSDNWPVTWADDGNLYSAYGDGWGFEPKMEEKLSLGLASIHGNPPEISGYNIRSETGERIGQGKNGIKASGMLMVNKVLYMLVRNDDNSRIAWSTNKAKSWKWVDWKFEESFGCPTFLNFGKNYKGARDEYVYIYSHDNESAYEPSDGMVLARVPKDKILEKEAYTYFSGTPNQPEWSANVADRSMIFRNSDKCYRSGITYNQGLERYLWCQIIPDFANGESRGPRFKGGLGIFESKNPWGPWRTVFYTLDWDTGPGETGSIPTKWMSKDGKSCYYLFSGDDYLSVRKLEFVLSN